GFSEDHSRLLQQRRQLINHCIHVCQIGSKLALLLGCTYTQKMDVCEGRSLLVRRCEAQTSGSDVSLKDFLQPGLVEWNLARLKFGEFTCIDIDPDYIMSQFSHAGRMCCSEVPCSKNRDVTSHVKFPIISIRCRYR